MRFPGRAAAFCVAGMFHRHGLDLDGEGTALDLGVNNIAVGVDEIAARQQELGRDFLNVGDILDAAERGALGNVSIEVAVRADLEHNRGERLVRIALLTLNAGNVVTILGSAGAHLLVVGLLELVAAAVALSLLASARHG